jgi:hypothetical protein
MPVKGRTDMVRAKARLMGLTPSGKSGETTRMHSTGS